MSSYSFELMARVASIPLFFRAPFIFILVFLFWGLNVFFMKRAKVNYARVLNLDQDEGTHLKPADIFWISGILFLLLFTCMTLYLSDVATTAAPVPIELYPILFYLIVFFLLVLPFDVFYYSSRQYLMERFRRAIFLKSRQGTYDHGEIPFEDRLFGDIITSLSKAIADTEVTFCVLFAHLRTPTISAEEARPSCVYSIFPPIFVSIPFLIRARQCIFTYTKKKSSSSAMNAGKYFSALPVIWLSALKREWERTNSPHVQQIKMLWIVFVSFNSMYTFFWDVVFDWGLADSTSRNKYLRNTLLYKRSFYYWLAVGIDFVLRVAWSLKLASHLHLTSEDYVFLFEITEVFRRFIWIFFRVEYEHVHMMDQHGLIMS